MPATGMPFTDGTTDAQANAVFVSGTTAYAVGVKSNGTNNIAMTWTKGNQDLQLSSTELTTGDLQASGNDIKLLGTNAYAVGWEADGNRHLAKVWLNTTPTTLVHRTASFDDLTSSTEANGVFLVGTDAGIDVYVSGSLADPSGASTAVYWLNDQIQVLSGAPQSSGNNIFALRH
jgi:hypothetical protein